MVRWLLALAAPALLLLVWACAENAPAAMSSARGNRHLLIRHLACVALVLTPGSR